MPDRIPDFDLYAELEVSRSASKATIEAAYRRLAKQTHPDATGRGDARFKRINLARQWLTDPEDRKRYDAATWFLAKLGGGSADERPAGRRRGAFAPGPSQAEPSRAAAHEPPRERARYGVNDVEVRQFLADLRSLNRSRAEEVRRGIGAADVSGRASARRAAFAAGKERRLREWLFAREATSIIVGTKLGDSSITSEVAEAMADVAGAITLRDLLMTHDFELLLLPWVWRDERILEDHVGKTRRWASFPWQARPAPAPRPAPPPPSSTRPAPRPIPQPVGHDQRRVLVGLSASSVVLVAALTLAALGSAFQPSDKTSDKNVTGASFLNVGAGATVNPSAPIGGSPSPASAPPVGIDPALLKDLQAGAARTIQRLRTAAAIGDVGTAKELLGESGTGLRVSGLMRAHFPDASARDIAITQTVDGWQASVGKDVLTSGDGVHWTFDYGERPLAVYRGLSEHNLYFLSGGQRDLFVEVPSVVISRSTVRVTLDWRFGSGDAGAFSGYRLGAITLGLDGRVYSIDPADAPLARLPGSTTEATLKIPIRVRPATYGTIDVAIVYPGSSPYVVVATTIDLKIL